MESNKETFNTWNKMANLYEQKFMHLDKYDATYDAFCEKIIKADSRILDIGTGPGNIVNYLQGNMPALQIEGIDISENMIERAQSNIPNGKFSVMDSRDLDQLKGPYDGIICGFCIPYLTATETDKLISNVFGLLTVKGIFYLSFVEGLESKSGWKTNSFGDRVYFYYHELEKIEKELNKIGFKDWQVSRVIFDTSKGTREEHTVLLVQK